MSRETERAKNLRYLAEVAPDPYLNWGEVNADEVLRFVTADGCGRAALSIDLMVPDMDDREAMGRWAVNAAAVMHAFDVHLLLSTLMELDSAKADEVAQMMVAAANDGGCYGEALWEWTDRLGIDAERICAEFRGLLSGDTQ